MTVQRRWSSGTKGVPREEREEQILSAAEAEFGERGYAGASIQRVAAASGISRALVHSYFATKDDLYAACVERAGSPLVEAVAAAQGASDPLTRALDTLRAILTTLESNRDAWAIMWDTSTPPRSAARARGRAYRHEMARLGVVGSAESLQRYGNMDRDDADLIGRIWLGIVTTVVEWWLERPAENSQAAVERCARIITALGA